MRIDEEPDEKWRGVEGEGAQEGMKSEQYFAIRISSQV